MGDGIQRKHALILNGDAETRHLQNVDRAAEFFSKTGYDHLAVLSPESPNVAPAFAQEFPGLARFHNFLSLLGKRPSLHYGTATPEGLKQMLATIKPDDDDLLAIYITGHGGEDGRGQSCVVMQDDSCLSYAALEESLRVLDYGKRIVLSDTCYAGNSILLFANEKTTVKSLGMEGELVACQQSNPFFFSDEVQDTNGDGIVSLEERFVFELEKGKPDSHPLYFSPFSAVSLDGQVGRPTFSPEVREVHNKEALQELLSGLQPGQLALVTFSADWCGPCRHYAPRFDALAKSLGGNYLMIRAEGRNGSERDWAEWQVDAYPTVAFLDYHGNVFRVQDRDFPMSGIEEKPIRMGIEAKTLDIEALYPMLAIAMDAVLAGEGSAKFSDLLGEAYRAFELFDPPYASTPLLSRKSRHAFVTTSLDLIFSRAQNPSLKPEQRIAYLEGFTRSLFLARTENGIHIHINPMLDSSLWSRAQSEFTRIAEHPASPPELRAAAQSLPKALLDIRRHHDSGLILSDSQLPKDYLKALRNWRQPAWILTGYLHALLLEFTETKNFSLTKRDNDQLVKALFDLYERRKSSPQSFAESSPEDLAMLGIFITFSLSYLDFNPSHPSYADGFYRMIQDKETHYTARAGLLGSALEQATKRSSVPGSYEMKWLHAVLVEMLEDPSDEQARKVALEALLNEIPKGLFQDYHLLRHGFAESDFWTSLQKPLRALTQESQHWEFHEVGLRIYWLRQPLGETPTWGYVDLPAYVDNFSVAVQVLSSIPGYQRSPSNELAREVSPKAPPKTHRFVGAP